MSVFLFFKEVLPSLPFWVLPVVCFVPPVPVFVLCVCLRGKRVFRALAEGFTVAAGVAIYCACGLETAILTVLLLGAECLTFYRLTALRREKREKASVKPAFTPSVPPVQSPPVHTPPVQQPPMQTSAPSPAAIPQKVCCFEPPVPPPPPEEPDSAVQDLQDANLCLDHAFDVIGRLKLAALSGTDRLEVDQVEMTLRMYRAKRMLTRGEMRSCNDCLALLLKLMTKYEV